MNVKAVNIFLILFACLCIGSSIFVQTKYGVVEQDLDSTRIENYNYEKEVELIEAAGIDYQPPRFVYNLRNFSLKESTFWTQKNYDIILLGDSTLVWNLDEALIRKIFPDKKVGIFGCESFYVNQQTIPFIKALIDYYLSPQGTLFLDFRLWNTDGDAFAYIKELLRPGKKHYFRLFNSLANSAQMPRDVWFSRPDLENFKKSKAELNFERQLYYSYDLYINHLEKVVAPKQYQWRHDATTKALQSQFVSVHSHGRQTSRHMSKNNFDFQKPVRGIPKPGMATPLYHKNMKNLANQLSNHNVVFIIPLSPHEVEQSQIRETAPQYFDNVVDLADAVPREKELQFQGGVTHLANEDTIYNTLLIADLVKKNLK